MSSLLHNGRGWDIDLKLGKFGESWCLFLGSEGRMEVKTDFRWPDTGNLFFEYRDHGVPSGISTTQSKYWGQVMNCEGTRCGVMVFDSVQLRAKLRLMLNEGTAWIKRGVGDDNAVDGIVVPLRLTHQLYIPTT